jgi:hypothetical protein
MARTRYGISANEKISLEYLQSYLHEYAWRYNAGQTGHAMFEQPVRRAAVNGQLPQGA